MTSLSVQQRLDQAVARLSGYRPGEVRWVLLAKDGYWGTTDWYNHVIWISPLIPPDRLDDVVRHEWSHIRSVNSYGGDVNAAIEAMGGYFGGGGLVGAERAADCMARLQGARWTHYTSCQDARWQQGAARLLAGQRL